VCNLLGFINCLGLNVRAYEFKQQVHAYHKLEITITRAPSVTLHIILLGVGGTIYNTHTLKPFKELGLDSQRVKKLASKLHVHSVNFTAELVQSIPDVPFPVLLSTLIRSWFQIKACNPPDPH